MSLPQHLTYLEGGTVSIDVLDLPAVANVSIVSGDGTTHGSGIAATVSTIDTTAANAITRGQRAINVVSATGMSVGQTMHIQDDPEEVLIRKVDGLEISLRRPVTLDHVTGATIEGSCITAAINSAVAGDLWWDGRCEWIIDGVKQFTAVECTKYPLDRLATVQDILDIEYSFYHLKDEELDVERLLDSALGDVLARIAVKSPDLRTRVFPASSEFRRVTALGALRMFYMRQRGEDARELFERYSGELIAEIDRICGTVPRDADQDGVIEPGDRVSFRSVRLER